jgi:hypothetical protein
VKLIAIGLLVAGVILGVVGWKIVANLKAIPDRVWRGERQGKIAIPILAKLLAEGEHKEYLVLLQNNMELRPTGGFLGSYARVSFTDGYLDSIKVEDIYVPDGQLPGYVEPPAPIKQYLNSNGWLLRDSNWDPDFSQAAPVIEWFFEQGKEPAAEGIVAVNLFVAQDLMRAVGPVYLADYQETVTAENLFAKAETHSEVGFFPGSTQKRDWLSLVAKQLIEKIKAADWRTQIKIVGAVRDSLRRKHILVWMKDAAMAQAMRRFNWDGKLIRQPTETDYLMIVEANLGVNKTNCCLERKIDQQVTLAADGRLREELIINYKNNNPVKPEPPQFWGGGYKNYLRVYLPKAAQLESVTINQLPLQLGEVGQEIKDDFLVAGFLMEVGGGESGEVKIAYSQPVPGDRVYRLKVQKQSGASDDPYSLTFHSPTCPTRQLNRNLDEDFTWETKLNCS